MSIVADVFEALDEAAGVTSKNSKVAALEVVKNLSSTHNDILIEILDYVINPFKRYYTHANKAWIANGTIEIDEGWELFKIILDNLSTRELSGNAAQIVLTGFMESLDSDWAIIWFSRVLNKDMRAGMGRGTVKKVFGEDPIPKFDVMRCNTLKIEKLKEKCLKYSIAEDKFDGLRCMMILENGGWTVLSRNGLPLHNANLIAKELHDHFGDGYVMDGEIFANDFINSIELVKATEERDPSDLVYKVFDCIPLADWVSSSCTLTLRERKEILAKFKKNQAEDSQVLIVEGVQLDCSSMEAWEKSLNKAFYAALGRNEEGIIIKDLDSAYVWKKSSNWLKYKPFKTDDFEVVDMEFGEGRLEGTVGALVVDVAGVEVHVGSGLTDKIRAILLEMHNNGQLIGKIIEVKYQPWDQHQDYSPDGSLRFPVFKRLREDKS